MFKTANSLRPEIHRFRFVSRTIVLSGIGLLLLGAAMASAVPRHGPSPSNELFAQVRNILKTLALVAGTVLVWVGAVRISLVTKPLLAIVFGLVLVVGALLVPVAVIRFFPEVGNYPWSGEYLLPLFALRISGFILMSTGLLRILFRRST